jgi:hypothetical protein
MTSVSINRETRNPLDATLKHCFIKTNDKWRLTRGSQKEKRGYETRNKKKKFREEQLLCMSKVSE